MKGICNTSANRLVRLVCSLTFFVCLFSCNRKSESEEIGIQWKNQRAIAAIIPPSLISGIPSDSISSLIAIHMADQESPVAIFGSFERKESGLLFTPVIPFTRGMHYHVRIRGKRVGSFQIPENNADNAPSVITVYPSADTLPENLLKIYLHFDRPMREGLSGKFVKLVENRRDTIDGAFLDLQPELWNPERTILTLWLDPGRIKRDLQPNKRLGAPLRLGMHYQILVSRAWTDTYGNQLAKSYEKAFITTAKDSLSPQPSHWILKPPAPATKQQLIIDVNESLDHSLLQEVFTIQDSNGAKISGHWQIGDAEKRCSFTPNTNWKSGPYKVLIEPRLEDLAGNNLVRPFDRDLAKGPKDITGEITLLRFNVK